MRKFNILWLAFIFLLIAVSLRAEQFKQFTVYDGGSSHTPDVSGDLVVWQTDEVGIYGKYLPDGDVFQISSNTFAFEPVVSGDIVVWTDRSGADYDIAGYDLAEDCNLVICEAVGKQQHPAIEGDIIVWQGEYDIYGYNLDTEQELEICVNDGANQYYPDIGEGYIVWMDRRSGDYEIYGYDLADGNTISVCTGNNYYHPAVDNSTVVWQYNGDIYGKYMPSGSDISICTDPCNQSNVAISGDKVVWKDSRNDDGDIYMYDLSLQQEIPIYMGNGEQKTPAIDGDTVVWEDGGDIYCVQKVSLQITAPNGGEMLLAGGQSEIHWQSVGPVGDFVKLEYSIDNGDNWSDVNDANIANTGTYIWDVNIVDSNQCLVKVADTADDVNDTSDGVFTIFECSHELTADVNGDCVVDLWDFAEFTSQWLVCGNPYDETWCWDE
jgi:beta propeller repeat protein